MKRSMALKLEEETAITWAMLMKIQGATSSSNKSQGAQEKKWG